MDAGHTTLRLHIPDRQSDDRFRIWCSLFEGPHEYREPLELDRRQAHHLYNLLAIWLTGKGGD